MTEALMEEHGDIRTPDRRNNNHSSLKTPNSPRRRKMMNRKLNSSLPPTLFTKSVTQVGTTLNNRMIRYHKLNSDIKGKKKHR